LFRDKRVPRENLNGLVVARDGLSAVLYTLTGIGGPWAQDPPYYAYVENFATGSVMDTSTTVIEDWRGWTHRRTIYFYHDGPIVVVDDARGPDESPAAVFWHLPEGAQIQGTRVLLRAGENPAEMVIVPLTGEIRSNGVEVQVQSSGHVSLITVFLTGQWVGAEVNRLEIVKADQRIVIGEAQP
jgi:hypothetical protein